MKTITIPAQKREKTGKKEAKKLRKEGYVPAVLYGGEGVEHLSIEAKSLKSIIYTPDAYLVELEFDSKKTKAIRYDQQFDPVSDELIHIDLLRVADDKPISVELPVSITGLAAGVKAGGKLQTLLRKLRVKGLAVNIPETLEIDVTEVGLGGTVKVGSLSYPNLELLTPKDAVVVAVKLTRAAKGQAAKGE